MFSFKKKKEVINLPELSNFNERTYPKKLKKIVAQLETCKSEDLNYIAECIFTKDGIYRPKHRWLQRWWY